MADGSAGGFAKQGFEAVREQFEANLADGTDLGASFCATIEGETVVDLWGGWADAARTRPWTAETIVNVWSVTKTMTATTALLLADRGELDFDAPVARYWPEFAAQGKGEIKVSHLMSHSAGLSGWREPMVHEDLYDWEKATSLLAAQAPLWEAGTASGYHALTQGYLVGEVVRRITGRSLGTVFRQEIAEPLGADFFIGMDEAEDARAADLVGPPNHDSLGANAASPVAAATWGNPRMDMAKTNQRGWRGAELPAFGGHGGARAVAEIHALLANGGVAKGKRIMSEAGARRALEPQIDGTDLVLGIPLKFGLGFGLPNQLVQMPNPNTIWWAGYGGSLAVIDMDARTTFAFAMNKMGDVTFGDLRAFRLAAAFRQALTAG